jgi:hypothetical protein
MLFTCEVAEFVDNIHTVGHDGPWFLDGNVIFMASDTKHTSIKVDTSKRKTINKSLDTRILPIRTISRPLNNYDACIFQRMLNKDGSVIPELTKQSDMGPLSFETIWFMFVDVKPRTSTSAWQ